MQKFGAESNYFWPTLCCLLTCSLEDVEDNLCKSSKSYFAEKHIYFDVPADCCSVM
jgi:hypothetical protein